MRSFRLVGIVFSVAISVTALSVLAVETQAAHTHASSPLVVWTPPSSLPEAAPVSSSPAVAAETHAPEPPVAPTASALYVGRVSIPSGPRAPMIHRLKISQRAVFITIDDGNYRDPRVLDLIRKTHLPVSAFLINSAVNVKPSFWQAMARAGVKIEDHTLTHPRLTSSGYAAQKKQICGPMRHYRSLFGRTPTLFRPPYGSYDARTLRATSDCGLTAAVNWSATYGGGVLKTWSGSKLRPGDIILMHFKPTLYNDLLKMMRILKSENLGVGSLERYLAPAPAPAPARPPSPTPSPSPAQSPDALPPPAPTPVPDPTPSPA
ncbi:MAG: polysaccharide deacetylase family protein [Actinomycetota bacterium]